MKITKKIKNKIDKELNDLGYELKKYDDEEIFKMGVQSEILKELKTIKEILLLK